MIAGIVQWAFGDDIPEWTGNKLHPVQLGLITIALSLITLACVSYMAHNPRAPTRNRVLAGFLILATIVICFTTVGRLWYLPGPILLVALVLLARPSQARPT